MAETFHLPRVKVCGLRRADDALAAAAAGADAVGLVAYPPSPRHVEEAQGAALVAALPPGVLPVLVTVDALPAALERLARRVGARAVQLCGDEHAADWRSFGLPVLRRLPVDEQAEDELDAWCDVAAGFVLDHPATPGGTGRRVDLDLAARLAAAAPCLLAGGLDAANVAAGIERVRPVGVDASSRLESAPGVKDPARIAAFVRAARAALLEVSA